jgi:hypothetical protein
MMNELWCNWQDDYDGTTDWYSVPVEKVTAKRVWLRHPTYRKRIALDREKLETKGYVLYDGQWWDAFHTVEEMHRCRMASSENRIADLAA